MPEGFLSSRAKNDHDNAIAINTGALVAGGMLFVNSGYGSLGMSGNVLLAFSVDGE